MGATNAGTSSEMGPILYNSLLGTRFRIVADYGGAREINAAMKRREIDGRANSTWASIKLTLRDEFASGKINVLIQMGLRKESELPDTPLLTDLVAGAHGYLAFHYELCVFGCGMGDHVVLRFKADPAMAVLAMDKCHE